jgi:hypothetical protein
LPLVSGKGASELRDDFNLRGLPRYFHDDWSVPEGVHPFMSEVARLAVHRGISQEDLAKKYAEITGRVSFQSANVLRHFAAPDRKDRKKRIQRRVVRAYVEILALDTEYVDLLLGFRRRDLFESFDDYVDHLLKPAYMRPLFEPNAIDDAMEILLQNEAVATECMNKAEWFWQRHRAFSWRFDDMGPKPMDSLRRGEYGSEYDWGYEIERTQPRDTFQSADDIEQYVVRWMAVAPLLHSRFGYDLLACKLKEVKRSRDVLLCEVFDSVYGLVGVHDWKAIQAQLEAVFVRNGLSIDGMRERLESFPLYSDTDWKA